MRFVLYFASISLHCQHISCSLLRNYIVYYDGNNSLYLVFVGRVVFLSILNYF
jgi:hypothetical protein